MGWEAQTGRLLPTFISLPKSYHHTHLNLPTVCPKHSGRLFPHSKMFQRWLSVFFYNKLFWALSQTPTIFMLFCVNLIFPYAMVIIRMKKALTPKHYASTIYVRKRQDSCLLQCGTGIKVQVFLTAKNVWICSRWPWTGIIWGGLSPPPVSVSVSVLKKPSCPNSAPQLVVSRVLPRWETVRKKSKFQTF